jgi:hypothetical protein
LVDISTGEFLVSEGNLENFYILSIPLIRVKLFSREVQIPEQLKIKMLLSLKTGHSSIILPTKN